MQVIRSIFVVASLILFVSCTIAEPHSWHYIDPTVPNDKGTISIYELEQEVVFSNHIVNDWVNCDPQNDTYLVCFQSRLLVMKLPKIAVLDGGWTEKGQTYSVVLHSELNLLGQQLGEVYVVSSKNNGFIYSVDRGVIAMFAVTDTSYDYALIQERCGFDAPESCHNASE